jgi:hypothetical protein
MQAGVQDLMYLVEPECTRMKVPALYCLGPRHHAGFNGHGRPIGDMRDCEWESPIQSCCLAMIPYRVYTTHLFWCRGVRAE